MSRGCLIVGRGTFGDMFPLFSVANNLLKAGWRVVIVADEHHRDTIAEMGVEFFSVGGKRDGTRRLRWETINSLAGHSILDEYSVTMKAAMGVDVIVGNQGAFVGRIVSKATGIPWVYCPVSPLALLSDGQPPLFPLIGRMQRRYRSCRFFQRLAVWGARLFTRVTTYKIVRFQSKLGVWDKKNPRFEGMYSEDLNLLLTSSHLVRSRIDWPNNTVIPGFAWFEPGFMVDAAKTSALSEFLTSGEAPVVIAPGGMVRVDPGNFYEKAIEAVNELGLRAIVVASKSIQPNIPSDGKNILVTGYMPYSEVLNGAKLLIHSGGIGAIGWALKFGLPSVVVPTVWDQFDNAELIEKNRIGCVEWASASNEWELSRLIRFALMNDEIKSNVIRFKDLISEENGGVAAANKIISFVEGGGGNSCLLQSR